MKTYDLENMEIRIAKLEGIILINRLDAMLLEEALHVISKTVGDDNHPESREGKIYKVATEALEAFRYGK